MYLGLIFSDTGKIGNDIKKNIQSKRSNVTLKYTNFCAKNYLAPLKVKLAVLHSCVISSLCYGSETWGENMPKELETVYKMGLKTALSVRFSTCNEIVYIESGTYPIACMIKKRQIKFWTSLIRTLDCNSPLGKLLQKANNINLPYIAYYETLHSNYASADTCEKNLQSNYMNRSKQKIKIAYDNDIDSKLGTYLQVNPDIETPSYDDNMFEIERVHIIRFRTGSNNLRIESGRFAIPKIPRESRLCVCGNGVQTLRHVLMGCTTVARMGHNNVFANSFTSVAEFF